MASPSESNIHITALKAGELPIIKKCSQCCRKNHCPFCPADVFKPRDVSSVKRHLKAHLKNAVHHNEYVICRCHLECRTAGHFHCVKCMKTIVRKEDFIKHLSQCKGTGPPHTQGWETNPAAIPPALSPREPMLNEAMDGTTPPLQRPGESSPPKSEMCPADGHVATAPAQESVKKKVKIQCPHCNIRLHKKNFKKHSDRKHREKHMSDAAAGPLLHAHRFNGGVFPTGADCVMKNAGDEAPGTLQLAEILQRCLDAPGCSISIRLTNHSRSYALINPQTYIFSGCCYDPPQPTIRLGATQTCLFGKASDGKFGVEGVLTYDVAAERDRVLGRLAVMFCVPFDCDNHENLFGLGFFKGDEKCDESLYRVMCCGDGGTFQRFMCHGSESSYTDPSNGLTIRGIMTPAAKSAMKVEFWDGGGI